MAAAARRADWTWLQIFASVLRVVWVRAIRARNPFPGISCHAEYAVWACASRKGIGGRSFVKARAESRAATIGRCVAPWIFPAVSAARGFLPFRFGRQSFALQRAVVTRA